MGSFFNIDPLSEKYAYQSHYNFSEDCVINSRELEGLEKVFFQNVLFKDERFQKAYQAERQTTGGKEFSNTLSSQNKINVLYTNFSNTNATGIAPLINNKKEFSDISKDFKIGVSAKEYDKISENGSKKIQLIGVSFGDKKTPAFDVAATLNHEEVAHSTEVIKKNEEQSNASGHKSYYGEYRETSPEDKAVLTDKKYEGTKANINLKELEQILEKPEK
ncbi:hypothetical protein [Chryseobacterium sp. ERMR1:04]|uniref:hypothetical protein n=1 Tax=Chryseobacterium sp. ERMR1:04 TaxID=1705393 RepID=UPI0006C8A76D|nr:hypothetical protein [Chryseobacterium sp. ERMR1:04]KPH14111.1 hypothetical protein AMQ68_00875 [Chryseobacterium sp. ERMR1:04]